MGWVWICPTVDRFSCRPRSFFSLFTSRFMVISGFWSYWSSRALGVLPEISGCHISGQANSDEDDSAGWCCEPAPGYQSMDWSATLSEENNLLIYCIWCICLVMFSQLFCFGPWFRTSQYSVTPSSGAEAPISGHTSPSPPWPRPGISSVAWRDDLNWLHPTSRETLRWLSWLSIKSGWLSINIWISNIH